MILIRVMGGLGNQMQQFALYEKLRSMGAGGQARSVLVS